MNTEKELTNIDCFHRAVADILARLYEQFPKRVPLLNAAQWQDNSRLPDACKYEFQPLHRNLYTETLHWLIDEGFIRVDEVDAAGNFINARLTSQGITALTHTVQKDAKERRIGDIFVKAAAKTLGSEAGRVAWEYATSLVPELIRLAFERASTVGIS